MVGNDEDVVDEEYERIVDQGLLRATLEAMREVEEGRERLIPWEEVERELSS